MPGFGGPNVANWIGDPQVQINPDGVHIRLEAPLTFQDSLGRFWTAEAGTVSDGTTEPKELWGIEGLSPFTGLCRDAAIMHDRNYAHSVDKDMADNLFYEGIVASGGSVAIATALYEAVHLFGRAAWTDDAIQNAKYAAAQLPTKA